MTHEVVTVPAMQLMAFSSRLALALTAALLPVAGAEWAPFAIPESLPGDTFVAIPPTPVGVHAPRVTVDGNHFALAGERYRVWGVNLCFGANLPPPPEAAAMARRLAALGINCVRLHHLDTCPYPSGLLNPSNVLAVYPEALDRLDGLVDQLARNGIRVDLNLHVGRRASKPLGLPDPGNDYDKMVDLFTPALIAAQKDYARSLLSHTNRYRGVTWAADPAVAFVEISNEDSLFMWDADKQLRALPACYADILAQRYADWLRRTYRTTARLREAWSPGAEVPGTNLLSGRISEPGPAPSWQLEVTLPAEASLDTNPVPHALTIKVRKPDPVAWHIQLKQAPLTVEAGRFYTLAFRARATKPRALSVGVSMDHEPWESLGLWHWTPLTTNWVSERVGFAAATNDTRARLAFVAGATDGDVDIADVSLQPGGRIGLASNESLDGAPVRLFGECETEARALDRVRFLADTEKAFFDDLRRFIRSDLRSRALVTGTVVFGPASLYTQGDMDYLDAHAYWQHPHFPGRPWDPADWVIEQQSMVDHPEWATLPELACGRLEGKPYTTSEYNHPAPNDYQAECVPLVASAAAAQDWDGVWLFAYSHGAPGVVRDHVESFFDIDANPAKLGFLPAGAALFRDGLMAPLAGGLTFGRGPRDDPLTAAAEWQRLHGDDLTKVFGDGGRSPVAAWQVDRLALSWRPGLHIKFPTTRGGTTRVRWTVDQGKGTYDVESTGGLVWAGWSNPAATSGVCVTAPAFAAVTASPLDGRYFAASRRVLITACGRCENTDQVFSADRRTVGQNWGHAPVKIDTVTGQVPLPPGRWRLWVLGPDGLKQGEAAVTERVPDSPQAELDAAHGTMWYLAERL